ADETAGDGRGGWTDQGPNDARNLPVGPQIWRGIPFEIIDPRTNQGRAAVVLKGRPWPALPAAVEFAVNLPCDVLYFLHAAAWVPREGLVARYVVTLADGSTHPVPLRGGEEIADWWRPSDTASLAVGWEGGNAESNELGLGIFPWTNPKPGSVVTKVRFEAGDRGALPMLLAVTAGNGPAVLAERPLTLEFTDTTGWYPWAFALNDPTLAEIDLSGLLDAPAGKHGFLTVREDGHFYFEDGTRARFFGTNVGGNQCSPDKATAELVAERLSRYGINMLRLHAPDSRWSPLIAYDQGNSRALDPAALDRYDYFVAKLLERGIYVYFDLLDYRQFLPGDEVMEADKLETRWANSLKGASIFDERMLTLQKEFATQLLTHRNPYTGRRYVDEPGLAVQEITNENSLFYLNNQRLMLPSYVEALTARWNRYLLQTYGDRAALAKAWTNAAGQSALLPEEDPARGTVLMPTRHLYADLRGADYVGEKSPARLNALTRFLYELEADYYRAIVAHLRALGLKCPITGTNQDFSDASNRVNATCDFTSRNNYWCHPDVDAKPFMRYDNAPMVRSEILRRSNPVAEVASSSAVGKPMIVPEFNYPWPNEWRAECLPLMACYGRLQDWDGLLYFAYGRPDDSLLSSFGNQTDPIRWGQVPLAALLFLRGDVETARGSVEVGVSLTDTFATRPSRASDHYSWYRLLPYLTKVRNAYFETVYRGQAEVTVASGHSASGDYRAARRAVLLADWPYVDQTASAPDRGASARVSVPGLRTEALVPPRKTSVGTFDTALDPASLPPGATPISYDGCAVGFESDSRLVMPHASALGEQDPAWLHRLWLRLARLWKLPSAAPDQEAGRVFRSDTGQLVLDRETGVFTANTPRARVVTGFAGGGTWRLGDVAVSCGTPFASISVVSLDSQPIAAARRLLITAVARSENTGQATLGTPGKASGSGDPAVVAGRRSLAE
ncbi:MAG: hypothetical protein HUU35_13945, partial [Armatimonadetes bacterium]|nr:hypothetical protein [Armatimonadota bacterium]